MYGSLLYALHMYLRPALQGVFWNCCTLFVWKYSTGWRYSTLISPLETEWQYLAMKGHCLRRKGAGVPSCLSSPSSGQQLSTGPRWHRVLNTCCLPSRGQSLENGQASHPLPCMSLCAHAVHCTVFIHKYPYIQQCTMGSILVGGDQRDAPISWYPYKETRAILTQ